MLLNIIILWRKTLKNNIWNNIFSSSNNLDLYNQLAMIDPESLRWNHYQYPLKKVSKYYNAILKPLFGCKQISFIWLENESLWISSFLYTLAIKMSYDSFPPLWRRERREENVYYVASRFSCNRNFHLTYITKHILIKKDSELHLFLNPSSKLLLHYSELCSSPSIQMFMRHLLCSRHSEGQIDPASCAVWPK